MSNLIEVKGLSKQFSLRKKPFFRKSSFFEVLKDVSLKIAEGETIGLVGESGSGKSTLGECIGGLQSAPENTIFFRGKALESLAGKEKQEFRRNVQFVFQNPYDTLNPRMNVEQILREPLRIHKLYESKQEENEAITRLLEEVGLGVEFKKYTPGQLSGGQCQRVAIARALSLKPGLIVCDEAVSALDVSVQATIVNLLSKLKQQYHISYLFISHDLGIVRSIADRVIVLEKGRIVENNETDQLFSNPEHPYTKMLLHSIPDFGY
ncbi:peptide ABC transporter substrate-binding protein [Bacillus sp. V3-13]|uniref:ABC transporter ATP-binding protein n=1 Tax=Bacillus sp. V3-13 TaxID=2053728 RepID=UPI000C787558|nr:ATP-binding cassette domain-containing protein [Bacillus sp. V3-13]PLR75762.1 peptide ABC transporter substrate-binding protein [Bacillus sp. V3-13]